MATNKRRPEIFIQVEDVEGDVWDVREARGTKYGFDLLFGSRVTHVPLDRCGLPRLIATQSLIDFWEANRTSSDGLTYDLPGGRSTLKRVRRRLGFNRGKDVNKFWRDRIKDLKRLSASQFAARHNVNIQHVFDWRNKLLGARARPLGWWRTPETIAVLQSGMKLREIGQQLGIGTTHAKRLKERAFLEQAA